jgi:UPF0271 protein
LLILFGLADSCLIEAGRTRGLQVASEVFADRTYQSNGSLTARTQPNALITDENVAVAQVLRMVREGAVRAVDGTDVSIKADTVCLHGDGPHPVEFAQKMNTKLKAEGFWIKAFGP